MNRIPILGEGYVLVRVKYKVIAIASTNLMQSVYKFVRIVIDLRT
jgi:hypothetical protein